MDKTYLGLMQKIQHEREKKRKKQRGIDEQSNKFTMCAFFPFVMLRN